MHVRLASDRGRGVVTGRSGTDLVVLSLSVLILSASCGRHAATDSDVIVELKTRPAPSAAGGVTDAVVTLRDRDRHPVRGARLRVEAFMSHPGMAPVLAIPVERGDGVYEVPLQLTMRGDWIVRVTGTLPDGRTVHRQIEIAAGW